MDEPRFALRVLIKTLVWFAVANFSFAIVYPIETLGSLSAYNHLLPGRARLPYGDNPEKAYNLSLFNLEAMFASHEIAAQAGSEDEVRVLLVGDSATWGFLLNSHETLAAQLNALHLTTADQRKVRFYNLGYPVMSLTKDLVVLSMVQRYRPDMIIWLVTLESFPYDKQLFPPLLQNNPAVVRQLITDYSLRLNPAHPDFKTTSFWQRTLIGARRPLADLFRLQLFGILWAATGIDQDIPDQFTPPQADFDADLSFHDLTPSQLHPQDLALDVLSAGFEIGGKTMLLVNEPIFISRGVNSHLRYNYFYPRWAYDDYRRILAKTSADHSIPYLDAWDLLPPEEFTNSAVHYTASGAIRLAEWLAPVVIAHLDGK